MSRLNWFTLAASVIAVIVVATGNSDQAAEIVLAVDGKSSCVVVTPARPNPEETTSTEWLVAALKQVTGADFAIKNDDDPNLPPTCICMGQTKAALDAGLRNDLMPSEE